MKIYNIFLPFIFIILLSSFATATINVTDFTHFWYFNETEGGYVVDRGSSPLNLTVTAGALITSTGCQANYTYCGYTDGINDLFNMASSPYVDGVNYTTYYFFKPVENIGNFDSFMGDVGAFFLEDNADDLYIGGRSGTGGYYFHEVAVDYVSTLNITWYSLWGTMELDPTNYDMYVFNQNESQGLTNWNAGTFYDADNFAVGGSSEASDYSSIYVEAVVVWDRVLNQSEINEANTKFLEGDIDYFLNPSTPTPPTPSVNHSLVLNMTFDDGLLLDSSEENHSFTNNGNVTLLNRTYCKWYGCANFSDTSGADYLNTTIKFSLDDGIAMSVWVYFTQSPASSGSYSSYFWGMGEQSLDTRKFVGSTYWGFGAELYADTGIVSTYTGTGDADISGQWYHYFYQYNPTTGDSLVYKNGALIENETQSYGDLNSTIGELLYIGRIAPDGTSNMRGYMDELLIWNSSDFNSSEILDIYQSKEFGTPVDLDVYVKDINYTLPFNWSDSSNSLIQGNNMTIYFTLGNEGINDSENFDWNLTLEDNIICSGTTQLDAKEEKDYNCDWETSSGYHKGYININITDDNSDNDIQRVYIPFLDRYLFHFNKTEFWNDLYPYMTNSSNLIAYDSYDWASSLACNDFVEGYDGNNVDPYGKRARECAMGCLVNNYTNPSGKYMCDYALNQVRGWANRTVSSYTDVQALHELAHVGIAFQI